MAQVELNVEVREDSGKGVARKLRAAGQLPAVVYGQNIEAQAIIVEPKALDAAIGGDAGWNTLITLKGAPAVNGKVVVLKDADFHPLTRKMISADFHAIDLQLKSVFLIPVNVIGKSEGEKMGGTLQLIRKELEVICLPTEVPQAIDIDVAALQIGDTVHIEEVQSPEGGELVFDVNFTVITVVGHKEEAVDEDEETEGEVADVEPAADAAE